MSGQLNHLLQLLLTKDIALAIENTPLHSPDDFNDLFRELNQQGVAKTANIGMCLDIGHANCCEATRNDYISFIDRLSSEVRIIHCHVHENWGNSDSHLALFTGPSKDNDRGIKLFIEKLRSRKFSGSMIMEQWPQEHEVLSNVFSRLVYLIGEQAVQREKIDENFAEGVLVKKENNLQTEQQNGVDHTKDTSVSQKSAYEIKQDDIRATHYYKRVRVKRDSADWVIDEIISFSKTRKSWRRRLEGVRDLFLSGKEMSLGDLAAVSAYLRFLSTAEIVCEEDGGHYRPCHHARAAQDIEDALENIKTPENAWIIRRIYPYLPSHAEEFTRHEPLTRIRDIAHRNDIPKEMKLDIKHNLQNKLHRSAGPEDLVTAKRILDKIDSDPRGYSSDFITEYKIFYQELLEFFNAAGLEVKLRKLSERVSALKTGIEKFIKVKKSSRSMEKVISGFMLRKEINTYLESNKTDVEAHIVDSELEDFAFMAISEVFNSLGATSGLTEDLFTVLDLTLRHIALNNYNLAEVEPVIHEFTIWKEEYFSARDRLTMLRLWASMQRGLRLCASFADLVTRIFANSVIEFGKAFRIDPQAVNIYCEGDIRANIIFQLSKILGKMSSVLMSELDLSPWSVINGGKVSGEVVLADNIREFEGKTGNYIVLLRKAEGDEEIPAAVRAVLLAHPLGHLSHLGVRARSGRIPFAAAEEGAAFEQYVSFAGKNLSLEFSEDGIREIAADFATNESAKIVSAIVEIPEVVLSTEVAVYVAEDIVAEECGAKAEASAKMYNDLSRFNSFSVPEVMAIPYGVMELCLSAQESLRMEYFNKVESLERCPDSELEKKLQEIQALIVKINLPDYLLNKIIAHFGDKAILAVRSSSSGEDLEGFAGAGLYESVIGVRVGELGKAIKDVWASLWTVRATLSRKKYNIPHSAVFMGVLIQEVVDAEFSFVMHTANPVTGKDNEIGIELAVGFGETLASANQPGSPCRIKNAVSETGISIEKCADISNKLVLAPHDSGLLSEPIDYADFTPFLGDKLEYIAGKLSGIGKELEDYFGVAQDIEGAFSNEKYYIVQSRAQAGIKE